MIGLVVGMGETGLPLYKLLKATHSKTYGHDRFDDGKKEYDRVDLGARITPVFDIIHFCIPFTSIIDYINDVKSYMMYRPTYIVVHSTVEPETTFALREAFPNHFFYHSPISGKHTADNQMMRDLLRYPKILGPAQDHDYNNRVVNYFNAAGMRVRLFSSSRASELAKLIATNYVGYLIAFRQEVERMADHFEVPEEELGYILGWDCEDFTKPRYPGVIRGHCVMPNLKISESVYPSNFWKLVFESNRKKIEREAMKIKRLRDE